MIKVVKFKKLRGGSKKYEITFNKNGKKYVRKFGSAGMSDFTKHKDKERRERYISRHKKDLKTKDPMKPGYLSMFILWNKPSLKASLADYKRRLRVYNRTGKFPTKITGSKKLKFGMISSIINSDSVRDLREYIGRKGDQMGSPFLRSIGLDAFDRITLENSIKEYKQWLEAGNKSDEVFEMVARLPLEMKGSRTDNTYKKYLSAAVDKIKKTSAANKIKNAWRQYKPPGVGDGWEFLSFGYSVPKNGCAKKRKSRFGGKYKFG